MKVTELSLTAMVLAAGQGMRMRPLTFETPKPLLKVGGKPMLDHALDKLRDAGIKRVVVNCFYLAEQIIAHAKKRTDLEIVFSHERELLDTGGGVKNVLREFEGKPFLVLNADLPWTDDKSAPSLPSMIEAFDPKLMDVELLLMSSTRARGFAKPGEVARGDFVMEKDGRLKRHNLKPPFPYVMCAAQIARPECYALISDKIFSNNLIWDQAEREGRLYGYEHQGTCFHVGTPHDLEEANALLQSGQGWD